MLFIVNFKAWSTNGFQASIEKKREAFQSIKMAMKMFKDHLCFSGKLTNCNYLPAYWAIPHFTIGDFFVLQFIVYNL